MIENKIQFVKNFIEDYFSRYPESVGVINKTQFAKMIYEKNKEDFNTVEYTRSFVRDVFGAKHKFYKENVLISLPEPTIELEDTTPYKITGVKKLLILSDIHGVFHDQKALEIAINDGIKNNCDGVLLNGDILDCYQLSRFSKDKSISRLNEEIEFGLELMDILNDNFGVTIWKLGNHENRFTDWMISKGSDISDMAKDFFNLEKMLKRYDAKFDYIENHRVIEFGKLRILHGNENYSGFGNAVNIARNNLLKAFDNIAVGHSHRSQSDMIRDINGDVFGAWSIGCLCNLQPKYRPINNWNHGYAICELYEDGDFCFYNKMIHNGKIYMR